MRALELVLALVGSTALAVLTYMLKLKMAAAVVIESEEGLGVRMINN
jgi:hypothetical protein